MNRNLTQPEEIDLVLLVMESNDSGMVKPMPEHVKPDVVIQDAGCDKSAIKPASPDREVHGNSEHGHPEPLPYVWSM